MRKRSETSSRWPATSAVRSGRSRKARSGGGQTDDGLDLEIDLPAGAVGDEIIAAHEAAGVVIRPLIDFDRSEFTDGPDGREYTRPHLRAFLVGATDTKAGWPDPTIDYDVEGRAAPVARRRDMAVAVLSPWPD